MEQEVIKVEGELIFSLPSLPPSMNAIYSIIYSQRRIELKPEVRLWKSKAKGFIPPWAMGEHEELELELNLHSNWIYKNGKARRLDLQNLLKVLIDAICEKWGVDDLRVRQIRATKVQADQEKVVVHAKRVKVS